MANWMLDYYTSEQHHLVMRYVVKFLQYLERKIYESIKCNKICIDDTPVIQKSDTCWLLCIDWLNWKVLKFQLCQALHNWEILIFDLS
jgi:hypothetical protein